MTIPMLFTPLQLRDVTFANRITVAPMCQYSAVDGFANDWHLVHLGALAKGGFAAVMTEAAAVQETGRITHGDIGLWSDAHAEALRPIIDFIRANGALAGIQLAHAGRKAAMQRPWRGNGPLGEADHALGDDPWAVMAPSAVPVTEGWLMPREMTPADIARLAEDFASAARRADALGCEFVEIHSGHGYLLQSFLSPLSNKRSDAYGGDRRGRSRALLEVAEAVRGAWPEGKPLFVRISSVDGFEGGWEIGDSVELAKDLKALGVDVIDCSSGGNQGASKVSAGAPLPAGYQLPYAQAIRQGAGIATQGVGLILDGPQAEAALQAGQADLIAIGRQALFDPFWPRHQAYDMGVNAFADWPEQYGWWLNRRERSIQAIREQG
ncbi:NADH:flavin oxidoreductase/NADH oxidase [Seohaeicola zhoushanensis]|uniref:NADH:flavin oxidoreductase / NADH oxidase n=1 Tax=Seohaeicola zhoushanensis TaxID=1569283 RepID=A0A8J3GUM8_9RHOB|nr:NADH:flavin oxidoreductase/NADH oxidase [Seohaeicola zhoushanensis]GHF35883.1 NADH:flavin oxidoreductase / NADH oxidase [Seohaeicola zhoushanensis]